MLTSLLLQETTSRRMTSSSTNATIFCIFIRLIGFLLDEVQDCVSVSKKMLWTVLIFLCFKICDDAFTNYVNSRQMIRDYDLRNNTWDSLQCCLKPTYTKC
ncbi:unnamed protein product [Larinioides sclopetarius]|uniref:Uncharacterized protein n=1 Tax=Larinioides sclopetarius TaxID=280406 RepID=A0AAV1ZJT5_9ARAC